MSSGEEIPQQQIYQQQRIYERLPEQDLKETDLESEQIPEQDVQETDLEYGGATIECAKEINDHLSRPDESVSIGGSLFKEIIGDEWKIGHLHFKVQWSDGTTTIESLKDMREDYSRRSAQYIVGNNVSSSKREVDRVLQWKKKVVRDLDRTVRRIVRLYDIHFDDHDEVRMTRRVKSLRRKHTFLGNVIINMVLRYRGT